VGHFPPPLRERVGVGGTVRTSWCVSGERAGHAFRRRPGAAKLSRPRTRAGGKWLRGAAGILGERLDAGHLAGMVLIGLGLAALDGRRFARLGHRSWRPAQLRP
jgi:hypothetical protein